MQKRETSGAGDPTHAQARVSEGGEVARPRLAEHRDGRRRLLEQHVQPGLVRHAARQRRALACLFAGAGRRARKGAAVPLGLTAELLA